MAGKKIFFDNFVSKNALTLPRKGRDPILVDLYRNARKLTLKRIVKVQATFDPFYPNIASFRELISFLNGKKIRLTNEECFMRTTVVSSGSEPEIQFFLKNGKKLVYKTGLLKTVDILYHLNDQLDKLESELAETGV